MTTPKDLSDPTMALQRTIADAHNQDVGRTVARLDPNDLEALGVSVGELLSIEGERCIYARALPTRGDARDQGIVQIDGIQRENAGVQLGDRVTIGAAGEIPRAQEVRINPDGSTPGDSDLDLLGRTVDGLIVHRGERLQVPRLTGGNHFFSIQHTDPSGFVSIGSSTRLLITESESTDTDAPGQKAPRVGGYEDIGGLGPQLDRIREIVEWPLRYPEVFQQLGIDAPRGVLLHGPPGCGKTLLARILARESGASFFAISGPEIIEKFYGESEARLREVFEAAQAQAPSIVFLDEVDAIAPRRENAAGDVERRVVATLLTLLDGLKSRGQVVVIAATNRPNAIDPALRRPGRFDREVHIPIPDRPARREVLEIFTRAMPLTEDVNLDYFADRTHGYVGADLEALCREGAIRALRRALGRYRAPSAGADLGDLRVSAQDLTEALADVKPSATREVFVEKPRVSWEDIGGMHEIRQRLVESLKWPLQYEALFQAADLRPTRGVLLHGPPGCGKTLLARAAASEFDVNFINVKGPELFDKFVGESERRLREIFAIARRAAPCMIFFDEIDSLAARRGPGAGDDPVASRLLGQFLTELDGLEELHRVFVLGATNRLDRLDEALLRPGRFDHVIALDPPKDEQRAQIFDVHLRRRPGAESIDRKELANLCENFTGADIAEVCRRATFRALRNLISDGSETPAVEELILRPIDLYAAISEIKQDKDF